MKMKDIQILKDIMIIENDRYTSSGDFSTTELIDPPRLVCMKKRYAEQLFRDIETQVDSLMGTAMHLLFEKNLCQLADPRYRLEEQVEHMFPTIDGAERKVSGRFDILYDGKHIIDIKTAKCWKKIFDPDLTGWTQQQNIYAQLLTHAGENIESVSALTIYKDWAANSALRDRKYPQEPIEMNELELWTPDQREAYVIDRLSQHVACETLDDTELPVCTNDERWERFPNGMQYQFALFKTQKTKRATKILHAAKNKTDAIELALAEKGVTGDSYIEIRHAERKRCERFCPVADFCDVHQAYMKKKKNNALNEIFPLKGLV